MDTALWLLYLADAAEGARHVLTAAVTLSLIALVCWIGGCLLTRAADEFWTPIAWPPTKMWVLLIVSASLAALIPSRTTLYAASAYYAGDAALHTQTGDRAVRALNAWLNRQIAGDDPSDQREVHHQ